MAQGARLIRALACAGVLALLPGRAAAQPAAAATQTTAEGWWQLGTTLYDRDDYTGAAAALRRATALDPRGGTAWVLLGLCEYHLGAYADALAHIQRGRQLGVSADAQFRQVMRYHEGLLLLHQAEFERAQTVLDELSADGVDSDDLDVAQGLAALRLRPTDAAAGDPQQHAIVVAAGRAQALAARQRFDEAQRAFETLARDHPRVRNVWYALGRYFVRTERPAEAVAAYERELSVTPDHVPARLGIAAILVQDDPGRALRLVEDALRLNPRLPLAHYLHGTLLLARGDTAAAIVALETAERSVQDDPGVYFALSRAYAKAGRTADAERARAAFTRLNEARQAAARRPPGGER
jgi:tetratricopeptide (TPR) repeat protein